MEFHHWLRLVFWQRLCAGDLFHAFRERMKQGSLLLPRFYCSDRNFEGLMQVEIFNFFDVVDWEIASRHFGIVSNEHIPKQALVRLLRVNRLGKSLDELESTRRYTFPQRACERDIANLQCFK
jgi:hypothetical protein